VPCQHQKAYRQSWPWRRERRKLCDYKKKLAEKKTIQTILTAKFEKYTRFRSPHISHMDFSHQQLTSPFLLPTPRVIGEPLEMLVAGIKHIASWSEAEGRLGSSPHQKEEMRAAKRSSSNSCAVVVPQQRCDLPLNIGPNLSGDLLLSAVVTPLENFLWKCSMEYALYPWISLLEFTLETSYKPQT